MTPPPPSARLRFRSWAPDDGALAAALWGDPAVTRLIGGPFDPAARLAAELASERAHGVQYWPAFQGEVLVGCCGLRARTPAERCFELGFHLLPAFWGQGLAGEAARAVIAHAFASGVSALFAGHHPANDASRRLLERLGFAYTHHERYAATGLDHPSYRLEAQEA